MNSSSKITEVAATSTIDIYNKYFHINEHYTEETTHKLFNFFLMFVNVVNNDSAISIRKKIFKSIDK